MTRQLLATILVGLSAASAPAQPNPAEVFDKEIRPLLAKYCHRCHDAKENQGELNLVDRFRDGKKAVADGDFWHGKFTERVMNLGDMPPDGSRRPSDPERDKLRAWLASLPKRGLDCNQIASDATQRFYRGYVMSRRLNRNEYSNSVRDLLGLDVQPAVDFPADGAGGEGFDNNGTALFTSPILMEKYLQAADRVVETLLPTPGRLAPTVARPAEPAAIETARGALLTPRPSEHLSARQAARAILSRLARRAYRRPVAEPELERLLDLFDRAAAQADLVTGDAFEQSLRLPIKSILISPNFLFLAEPEPAKDGVYRLPAHPLAARLSYFLWASLPDEELSALADSGKLLEPEILRAQVRRMLADPRSRGLAESFSLQWLGLTALGDTVKPDGDRFPEFTPELAADMRAEAVALLEHVLREDRPLTELLDSDTVFVNERLAGLYGIPNVLGPQFRPVKLGDRERQQGRGGVLGLAGVLTSTSYPLRTSPVLRGKWVLEELLGSKVPPPPPNAGELPPDDKPVGGLSLRQRLEAHRTKAECVACHARMDPLGFGLESFDPIGRWRTRTSTGEAIDSSGVLPSGERFSGPAELKAILLTRRAEFLRNLTRKLVGYALGRELNPFDECVIRDGLAALEANGQRPSALLEVIALSKPFQYRFVKK